MKVRMIIEFNVEKKLSYKAMGALQEELESTAHDLNGDAFEGVKVIDPGVSVKVIQGVKNEQVKFSNKCRSKSRS